MAKSVKHGYEVEESSWTEIKGERREIYETKEPRRGNVSTSSSTNAQLISHSSASSVPSATNSVTNSSDLTSKLKALYKAQDTLPQLIEDSSLPDQRMDDYYVKLQILLNDKGKEGEKQPIDLTYIFDKVENQEAASKVLITGVAGVGKTTFLSHVSYEWSNGKIFNDKFDYVFKIKLKSLLDEDLCNELKKNYTSPDRLTVLIQRCIERQQIDQRVKDSSATEDSLEIITFHEIRAVDKSKTLLLLDGYDEIEHLNRGSHVVREIVSKIFEYPNVVMTTRPNALSSNLDSLFERRIENVGFGDEGIDSYIDKYFANQARKLIEEIEEYLFKTSKSQDSTKKGELFQYYEGDPDKRDILIRLEQIDKDRDLNETIIAFKEHIREYHHSLKENLSKLLSQNLTLKFALATPINAVMTCLVSSDVEIMQRFEGEFNAGTIYEGVIVWLGKRYLTKFAPDDTHNLYSDRILNLKLLSVFKEVAHNKFAINKTHVSGAELDKLAYKTDTELGIKKVNQFGLLKSEGGKMGFKLELKLHGIPTDSSIKPNELSLYLQEDELYYAMIGRNGLERSCITEKVIPSNILNIIKSSLSKKQRNLSEEAEQALLQFVGEKGYILYNDSREFEANSLAAKEMRDLIHRDHTFIHLSFQEYLNAYKLKEKLLDDENAQEAAILIATHRNEPKYLMTLKFLSGLVSNEQNQLATGQDNQSNQLVTRFWEAVTCNVDGVLELGIETKVTLLMHLLNQAKVKGTIDLRIPNLLVIKDLIDKTVLKDITKWGQQIIDSGYLSEKIVGKLILILGKNEDGSLALELSEQTPSKGKENKEEYKGAAKEQEFTFITIDKTQELKIAVEVITSLINKSEFGGRGTIFKQLLSLLNSHDWEIQKLALQKLAKIVDITIDKSLLEVYAKLITPFITDDNLGNNATNALYKIIKIIPIIASRAIEHLFSVLGNKESSEAPMPAAIKALAGIVKALPSTAIEAVEAIKGILYDKKASKINKSSATHALIEIIKAQPSTNIEAVKAIKGILNDKEANKDIKWIATKALAEIVKIQPSTAIEAFDTIKAILNNKETSDDFLNSAAIKALAEIVKIQPSTAIEAVEIIKTILNDQEASRELTYSATHALVKIVKTQPSTAIEAVKAIKDILKATRQDRKVAATAALDEIVQALPPVEAFESIKCVLNACEAEVFLKRTASENLAVIIVKSWASTAIEAVEAIKGILNDQEASLCFKEVAINALAKIVKALPSTAIEAVKATKGLLNDQAASFVLKEAAINALAKIVKAQASTALEVFEVIKGILNDQEASFVFKAAAINALAKIVKAQASTAIEVFEIINGIIKDQATSEDLKCVATNVLAEMVEVQPSTAIEAVEAIKFMLNNQAAIENFKDAAVNALAKIVKATPSSSIEAFEAIKDILNDKAEAVSEDLKCEAAHTLAAIVKSMPACAAEAFDAMKSILESKQSSNSLKGAAAHTLAAIVKSMPACAAEAFDAMKIILESKQANNFQSSNILKRGAIEALRGIVEVMTPAEAFEAIKAILNSKEIDNYYKATTTRRLPEILKAMPIDKVADLLNNQIKAVRDSAVKSISDKLKNTEEVKQLDYKHASIILSIIDASKGDEEAKELNLLAKKALEHILTTVYEIGIKWLSDHFAELPASSESKAFLKAIFHQTLSDGIISEIENEFILNCITKLGFTASVSREGEIIFEGVKYPMDIASDKLEEIAREILKNSDDLLAQYYRNHTPLFINSGSAMPIASLDLQDGGSVLKGQALEGDKWLVSLLHLSDDKKTAPAKVFILLEKANNFGGHYIYKIFVNEIGKLEVSNKYDIPPGEISIELRKKIFGEMDYHDRAIFGKPTKLKYYGSIVEAGLVNGNALIESAQNNQNQYTSKDEYMLMRKLLQPIMGNNLLDDANDWSKYSASSEQVQEFSKAQLFPGLNLDKRDSVIVEQHRSGVSIENKVEKLEYRLDQADKIAKALNEKLKASSALNKKDKAAIKSEIGSLKEALKNIKAKVDSQDPILKIITAEVNELINAKDISYEVINDINEKLEKLTLGSEPCFYVKEIIYDNELLNHPEMFNKLVNIHGANKVLNLVNQMSPELLHAAIEAGNLELLGSILSLD